MNPNLGWFKSFKDKGKQAQLIKKSIFNHPEPSGIATKSDPFLMGLRDLTLINEVMEEVTEAGEFKFWIGSSSNDIRLEGSFVYED